MKTKTNNDSPKLRIREETFGNGTISFKELEPDSGKWKVIGFENLDLKDLSRAIYKQLLYKEYRIVKISDIKLNQGFSQEEIYLALANSISSQMLKTIFL